MLSYQKNTLLSLLAQFEMKFADSLNVGESTPMDRTKEEAKYIDVIERNIQSIRKQITRRS